MLKKVWSYRVVRFVAVGTFNTLFDFAILNFLVFAFNLNNIIANSISVSIAMGFSYILNNFVVFNQKNEEHTRKLLSFIVVTGFGMFILQNLTIFVFTNYVTWPADIVLRLFNLANIDLSREFIILNTAKVIGTAVNMTWNFLMYKKFVFKAPTDL